MTVRHDDCATRGANAIYDYATNGCVTFVLQKGVKSMLKCNFFLLRKIQNCCNFAPFLGNLSICVDFCKLFDNF